MAERNPLWSQITELEQPIVNLHNGLEALGDVVQAAVESNPSVDISALWFVETGLGAVRDDLKAKYYALREAASGSAEP